MKIKLLKKLKKKAFKAIKLQSIEGKIKVVLYGIPINMGYYCIGNTYIEEAFKDLKSARRDYILRELMIIRDKYLNSKFNKL